MEKREVERWLRVKGKVAVEDGEAVGEEEEVDL